MAKSVLVLGNPKAGRGPKQRITGELIDALGRRGLNAERVDSLDDLTRRIVRLQQSDDLRCVVAVGGDGTVRAVVNAIPAALLPLVPVAILPMGTENLVAREFGIPSSAIQLSQSIADRKLTPIDVGRVNGELFLAMFSCGFDAEVIRRLHQNRRGNITHWSYARPIFESLTGYRFPALRIRVENRLHQTADEFECAWAFAFNLPRYARGIPIAPAANANDGMFDTCFYRGRSVFSAFFHFLTTVLGLHGRWSGCRRERCTNLRIEADLPVPYQIDGDAGGMLPVELDILSNHVSIVLPTESA